MDKYVLFTAADFPAFLAELAMFGGYGDLIFLHDRFSGGLYILADKEKKMAKTGLKLYASPKAVERLVKKGFNLSERVEKLTALYPESSFKNQTSAKLRLILFEYYKTNIPFLKIYSFTEGIYSSLIDATIRNFIFKSIKDKEQAARAFTALLNPSNQKTVAIEREEILHKTAAPQLIIDLCSSVRKMGSAKFILRSTVNKSYGFLTSLLKEISRRYCLSPAQCQACRRDEVIKILEGKTVDTAAINERVKFFAAFMKKNEPKFLTGPCGRKTIDRIKFIIPEKVTEFRGDPASAGRATGEVMVLPVILAKSGQGLLRAKIKKMKKGDILVANTTGPEMVMACRKAGGIVANEGGINSHAAIVSRELGIPGIVSTKIATQVLKDGDIIEVDADNGIVKIVEKTR
ncbi:MAG TPA: PEP-utilizing enzyme [Candidatus Paceibacterota bacterium]|nr:PEP-utilizing enzyme [Candidatus Pacearchaeota archaeon]HRZ51370.1 PEP-utilizing enzyme [Candidatus Paceibacterota bacterium]HSA37092.1 PEP-utilizing enzyme [Candidatus Paceibacterota bacterium]